MSHDADLRAGMARGVGAAGLQLVLIAYWFGLADRYQVFLYGHVDRPGDAPATAFDPLTTSRYWMAPFVAAGILLVLLLARSGLPALQGRPARSWSWRRASIVAAPLLAIGTPFLTMSLDSPTMPAAVALRVTIAALLGSTLALATSHGIERDPRGTFWLAVESLGLLSPLLATRAVALPARGILDLEPAWSIATLGWLLGLGWLRAVSRLRVVRGQPAPGLCRLVLAAYVWAMLGFPLAHHLLATPPGFRYVTAASNIFGYDLATALTSFLIVLATAVLNRVMEGVVAPNPEGAA